MTSQADRRSALASSAEEKTRQWLNNFVVKLNLCPFAKKEIENESLRIATYLDESDDGLLEALATELQFLEREALIETTLFVAPLHLQQFDKFLEFLESANDLLDALSLDGVYQIASFHPHYQFAETEIDDAENYTNRAPHPTVHLLRESSMERAISGHSDTGTIPLDNIRKMNSLGVDRLEELLKC